MRPELENRPGRVATYLGCYVTPGTSNADVSLALGHGLAKALFVRLEPSLAQEAFPDVTVEVQVPASDAGPHTTAWRTIGSMRTGESPWRWHRVSGTFHLDRIRLRATGMPIPVRVGRLTALLSQAPAGDVLDCAEHLIVLARTRKTVTLALARGGPTVTVPRVLVEPSGVQSRIALAVPGGYGVVCLGADELPSVVGTTSSDGDFKSSRLASGTRRTTRDDYTIGPGLDDFHGMGDGHIPDFSHWLTGPGGYAILDRWGMPAVLCSAVSSALELQAFLLDDGGVVLKWRSPKVFSDCREARCRLDDLAKFLRGTKPDGASSPFSQSGVSWDDTTTAYGLMLSDLAADFPDGSRASRELRGFLQAGVLPRFKRALANHLSWQAGCTVGMAWSPLSEVLDGRVARVSVIHNDRLIMRVVSADQHGKTMPGSEFEIPRAFLPRGLSPRIGMEVGFALESR